MNDSVHIIYSRKSAVERERSHGTSLDTIDRSELYSNFHGNTRGVHLFLVGCSTSVTDDREHASALEVSGCVEGASDPHGVLGLPEGGSLSFRIILHFTTGVSRKLFLLTQGCFTKLHFTYVCAISAYCGSWPPT